MTERELIDCVEAEGFHWKKHTHDGVAGVLLHWPNPNNPDDGECCHIALSALPDLTWRQVRTHVINGRDLKHYTRIVGYYSGVRNWNKSKLGELKDRHKGDYRVGRQ